MKLIACLVLTGIVLSGFIAHAEETWTEKAGAKGHEVKRELKKAAHRIEETTCADGTVTCAGRKAANRIEEAKDAAVDGAKNLKNKID